MIRTHKKHNHNKSLTSKVEGTMEQRKCFLKNILSTDSSPEGYRNDVDSIMVTFIEYIFMETHSILDCPAHDIVKYFSATLYDEIKCLQKLLGRKSLHTSHKLRQFLAVHDLCIDDLMKFTRRDLSIDYHPFEADSTNVFLKYAPLACNKNKAKLVNKSKSRRRMLMPKIKIKQDWHHTLIHDSVIHDDVDGSIVYNDAVLGSVSMPPTLAVTHSISSTNSNSTINNINNNITLTNNIESVVNMERLTADFEEEFASNLNKYD